MRKSIAMAARVVAGFALVGSVSAVAVEAASASANAAPPKSRKVKICHRTGSDKHPYVLIEVDKNSAKFKGHLAHRNDPARWKKGRRDFIDGLDGSIKTIKDCPNGGKPVPPGKPPVQKPPVIFPPKVAKKLAGSPCRVAAVSSAVARPLC